MPKFRKKPVVIDAMQWDGTEASAADIMHWCGQRLVCGNGMMIIHTLEGDMRASRGDWIIRGVKGEFYPCKPDIFDATYESLEDTAE